MFNRKRNRLRRGQRRVLDGAACRGTGAIELTLKEIREPRAERPEKGRRTRAGVGGGGGGGGILSRTKILRRRKSRRRGYVRLMLAREEERGERAQELTESFL